MKTSAAWRRLRATLLDRAGHECENCGLYGDGVQLAVHHRYYESGKRPWDYPSASLDVLCPRCHGQADDLRRRLNRAIGALDSSDAWRALGFMQGLVGKVYFENYEHTEGAIAARVLHEDRSRPTALVVTP